MRPNLLHPGFTTRSLRGCACIMTLALLAACASTPPPNDQMQRAQNALHRAQQAGASDYDPVDLQFASSKFQQAQAAMAAKKYDDAAMRADESRADAQLAFTKSRLAVERQKIQAQAKENARLRSQLLQARHGSGQGASGGGSAPASSGSTLTLPDQVLPQPPEPAPASSSPSADTTQGGGA